MKCPVCPDSTLAMTNREGIEIDYCPSCRGVWLDRGELDKIIERSAAEQAPAQAAQQQPPPYSQAPPQRSEHYGDRDRYRGDYDDDHRYREQGYYKKRKKGLLGDLFDFD